MNVSVVIPCYNEDAFIGQAIGSVFEQSRPADEIIVVDDGSTDRSAEIARRFGEPVTVLSKQGGGAAEARNDGADYASGDALMFLDADDVLGPDVLEGLVAHLERHPGSVVACPWFRLDKVDDRWVQRPPSCASLEEGQDYLSGWITGWYHPPCSVLWPRGVYEQTGGWDHDVKVNQDGDLMMRALVDGIDFRITDRGAAYYRRLPDEQQLASQSGARFTRSGRASQMYVLRKIAHKLDERGRLPAYRTPLTQALERIRAACRSQYPELSDACTELINRYGEPRPMRIARKVTGRLRHAARRRQNRAGRMLSRVRNGSQATGSGQEQQQVRSCRDEEEREITFGCAAYRAASDDRGKAPVVVPSRPRVSVIIPTYNRAGVIGRALTSVINQRYEDFEVLVIDDGSDDDTDEVVRRYQDARIRYLAQPRNMGVGAARNRGLREARGEFIAFLDSDDEWFSDKLAKQIQLFQSVSGRVGLVYSGVEAVDGEGETSVARPERRGDVYRDLLLRNVIHGGCSNVMIRRNVIRTAGFFDEAFPAIEDYDYWLRIARYHEVDFVEEPLMRYYNVSGVQRKSLEINKNMEARRMFFEKHRREMRRAGVAQQFLLETAQRELLWRSNPDYDAARQVTIQALKEKPFDDEVYRFILWRFFPRVHKGLRSVVGRTKMLFGD